MSAVADYLTETFSCLDPLFLLIEEDLYLCCPLSAKMDRK